eukprot:7852453-Alexandrium_andersonii.AAC.1
MPASGRESGSQVRMSKKPPRSTQHLPPCPSPCEATASSAPRAAVARPPIRRGSFGSFCSYDEVNDGELSPMPLMPNESMFKNPYMDRSH